MSTSGPEAKLKAKVKKWVTENYTREEIIIRPFHPASFRGRPVGETGWPDHDYFVRGGRTFFCEYKTPGGKVTDIQAHRIEELRDLGFTVYVIYKFVEAQAVITSEVKDARKPCTT